MKMLASSYSIDKKRGLLNNRFELFLTVRDTSNIDEELSDPFFIVFSERVIFAS